GIFIFVIPAGKDIKDLTIGINLPINIAQFPYLFSKVIVLSKSLVLIPIYLPCLCIKRYIRSSPIQAPMPYNTNAPSTAPTTANIHTTTILKLDCVVINPANVNTISEGKGCIIYSKNTSIKITTYPYWV